MSLLSKAAGFFTEGKLKMVQRSNVHFVNINITTNGLEFIGTSIRLPGISKNSTGFRFDVPWAHIENIVKGKTRIMHVVFIYTTLKNFYTILPIDSQNMSGAGVSSSKKNSKDLLEAIIKAQVDASKSVYCTNCGEPIKPDSDFCGNCGYKFS